MSMPLEELIRRLHERYIACLYEIEAGNATQGVEIEYEQLSAILGFMDCEGISNV